MSMSDVAKKKKKYHRITKLSKQNVSNVEGREEEKHKKVIERTKSAAEKKQLQLDLLLKKYLKAFCITFAN